MSLDQEQYDRDLQRAMKIKENGSEVQLRNTLETLRRCYGLNPVEFESDVASIGDVHETVRYEPDSNVTVSLLPEIDESSQAT